MKAPALARDPALPSPRDLADLTDEEALAWAWRLSRKSDAALVRELAVIRDQQRRAWITVKARGPSPELDRALSNLQVMENLRIHARFLRQCRRRGNP